MTTFRPCIDLHQGRVKQIIGGTLVDEGTDGADGSAVENFVSEKSADWYAELYRGDELRGGHVIQLGPGNKEAALAALAAWPGGLQVGGGINKDNARQWLEAGASHVIVTSALFEGAQFKRERLNELLEVVNPEQLVIDLSCRRVDGGWAVATNRWQTVTDERITSTLLSELAEHCSEFLIHAADVEGLCRGIDEELVALLGEISPLPCTYAGGARSIEDLRLVERLSGGKVDLTYGSALDIFGGSLVRYEDCVQFNRSGNPVSEA